MDKTALLTFNPDDMKIDLFNPDRDALLNKWGEFADRIERISPWTTKAEIAWLMEAASRNMIVGEVGSYKGKSCKAMAHACSGKVYAVDRFQDKTELDFRENLREELLREKVSLLPMESSDGAKFLKGKVEFELFFIDADHLKDDVLRDIKIWLPLMAQNSLLAFHDCYPDEPDNGIAQALKEALPNYKLVIDSIAVVLVK